MRKLNSSGAAVSLSVLTTVMGQCILSGEAVSARTLLLQGLPMALALAVISRLLALAEVEQGTFSGNTFCSKLFCLLATLWFGAELAETLGQIQTLCWEQFSSMALVGILPLLLWAGWTLEPGVFSRSAGILWWAVVLAAAICFLFLGAVLTMAISALWSPAGSSAQSSLSSNLAARVTRTRRPLSPQG